MNFASLPDGLMPEAWPARAGDRARAADSARWADVSITAVNVRRLSEPATFALFLPRQMRLWVGDSLVPDPVQADLRCRHPAEGDPRPFAASSTNRGSAGLPAVGQGTGWFSGIGWAGAWEARNLRSRPVIRMILTSDGIGEVT